MTYAGRPLLPRFTKTQHRRGPRSGAPSTPRRKNAPIPCRAWAKAVRVGVIFRARKMPAYADFYVKQRIVAPHRKTYSPSQNEQKETPAGRKKSHALHSYAVRLRWQRAGLSTRFEAL